MEYRNISRVHDFVFCDILLGGGRRKERVAAAQRMRKQAVILRGHQTLTQWQLLKVKLCQVF
jgi:hypothetical protein